MKKSGSWMFFYFRTMTTVLSFQLSFFLFGSTAQAMGYVAEPPYVVNVSGASISIDLAGISRAFDFGGTAPFINASTGVNDIETINYWNAALKQSAVQTSRNFPAAGISGRVFKTGGYTAIGYAAGDGVVEGSLRTMINSFAIPTHRRLIWELTFKLGGERLDKPWYMTPRGYAPATLWQIKSAGLPPAFNMAVDTDPNNPDRLMLQFDAVLNPARAAVRLGEIGNLSPSQEISVYIDAVLDERKVSEGGIGNLRVLVNRATIINRAGPILQAEAVRPYSWSLAMYLYANKTPLSFSRFGYWRTARMMTME